MLWGALALRAAYLQFLPNEKLNTLQARQFQTVVTLPSRRGNILDTKGKDLAMSSPAYSIYADPKVIKNKRSFAKEVSRVLSIPSSVIMKKISDRKKRFIWIDRLVDATTTEILKQKNIHGLGFVEEWRRIYPNDHLLSTTLGFIGKDGLGLEGIELMYDKELKGESKKVSLRKDARGRPLVQDGTVFTEPPQGKDIQLTIDSDLQYFVETELMQALQTHEAEAAYAVVLDAKTSAIRAIASLPDFDLNQPEKSKSEFRRNKVITDTYEPGSTIKTFILTEALEKNIYKANSKIFCENGNFKIGKRVIHEAEKAHAQGLITVSEILAYSSNIGTSKIALKLGDLALRNALLRFGFGQKSGLDLPGESKGIILGLPWRDHLLANVSFGQGMTASPLQIANAYAAIANGGILNRPYIIQSITDTETNQKTENKPIEIRRVVSEETAQQVRMMLAGVTTGKGSGLAARVPGYIVGGKTGTAQKVKTNGRGYVPGGYIGSFSGFIPANDPQYVIYVALDHPKKGYYGSQVAAPLFANIASYAVRKDGVAPEILAEKDLTQVPVAQTPFNGMQLKKYTLHDFKNEKQILTATPELKNLSVREVLQRVHQQEIKIKFIGSGQVTKTSPEAGEALNQDRQMTVYLNE
jgi:cell division protein FtsI (penicillin-binding protein 3)